MSSRPGAQPPLESVPVLFDASRRLFLTRSAAFGGLAGLGGLSLLEGGQAPAIVTAASDRPVVSHGLQIGDVQGDRAVVWSRADRPARLVVEWSRREDFADALRVHGPWALPQADHTARVELTGLPAGQDVFVRVRFEADKGRSEPVLGRFCTAPRQPRHVTFVWGADTAGQGWGIDRERGGMKTYETMRQVRPDFFIHSGDTIYADGPMSDSVRLADGTLWRNAYLDMVPAKRAVAQATDDFRGNYRYNLMDENLRRFNAEVAQVWQWDDHEVMNNWSPGKDLAGDPRYAEKRVATLAGRARRAFLEYSPTSWPAAARGPERIFRRIPYGPDLDLFVLDMRSYRGPNSFNRQERPGPDTAFLGPAQLEWLKRGLAGSKAAWKVVAADMPLGLLVEDGRDAQGRPRFEAVANGDGPALGRELEIADLLSFLKRHRVRGVVWITGDVHYCAAHHYQPARARFQDFDPFWEFVAGPLHAGTFGPSVLDDTFGPQVAFQKAPPAGQSNLPPSDGMQFFGQVDVVPGGGEMTVSLKDVAGTTLFAQRLSGTGSGRA